MDLEELLLIVLVLVAVLIAVRIVYHFYKSRTSLYLKGSVDEAVEAFKNNTDPLLSDLAPPNGCEKAAGTVRKLKQHYVKMLKRANRHTEDSEAYRKIFAEALNPVLDKIEYATTTRECFKNAEYKNAFDQFIATVQKQSKFTQKDAP